MELIIFDEKVRGLVNPDSPLEKLATGFVFTEGPVFYNGTYYFTDFTVDKIYKYKDGTVTLITDKSEYTVGMAYDRKRGRIIRCAMARRSITDLDGNVIVNNYQGIPINGGNDIIADSKGRVYFTDPIPGSLKLEGAKRGYPAVFLYDPDSGEMTMLDKTLGRPNGLALSPDEKILYIIDSNAFAVYRMELPSGKLEPFITLDKSMGPGGPDGMCVDELGNLYVTGPGGIWLVTPEGKALGIIKMPEFAANLCFDDKGLFITASTSIYRADTGGVR